MDNNVKWFNKIRIERTIEALEKNNMNGYYVENNDELISKIEEIVSEGATVACGGSMTLFETNIIDYLRKGRYNFLDRYAEGLNKDDINKIYRQAFSADAYFVSSNAITENGEIYNVDGTGNRVAAMIYGPDKVIIICGVNKIVKDVNEAIHRTKTIAAPINAKRIDRKTPCCKVGCCMDCNSPERICNDYTLIRKQANKDRIHVIFLDEELGY